MIAAILVIAFSGSDSGAASAPAESADSRAQSVLTAARVTAPVKCPSARGAVRFYSRRLNEHRVRVGAPPYRQPAVLTGCPRYIAHVLQRKSRAWRLRAERWVSDHTLADVRSWTVAVRIVQKFFPGTELWMLDCSDAEGYNKGDPTRWVVYGGGPFSMAAWYSDTVGGPPQYRPSTFKGHYRHGLDSITGRGYRVPRHLRDPGTTTAWRSMLAQAIAMGWARWSGNDNSHWSASFGNGC